MSCYFHLILPCRRLQCVGWAWKWALTGWTVLVASVPAYGALQATEANTLASVPLP